MEEILKKLKENEAVIVVEKNGKKEVYGEIQRLNNEGKEKISCLASGASVLFGPEKVKIVVKKEEKIEFLKKEDLKFL